MTLNWIDLLLGALILLGIVMGWRRGFVLEFLDLAAWLASLLVGIRFYQPVAQWLAKLTDWPLAWSRPASFLAIFFLSVLVLQLLAAKLIVRLPPTAHRHPGNRLLGILPGLVNGAVHATIVAALLLAVPLPENMQNQARDSELNNRFAGYAEAIEFKLRPVFDEAITETLNMLTVQPESSEMVKLPFTVSDARPRPALEEQMLELVNKERAKANLSPLVMDAALTSVARQHSADMLARGYFSHYSPEGKSAFDRLRAAKIAFLLAGENLAFAPTVRLAHSGLMNSPGHRANILRPRFERIGIGIMDAGPRGIMVTQQFKN
ncbi:MAG TPA: colicin V production protein [Oxalobacteraceae bacterium]|nr:colicin V production protein [Oxalobacteraceae bacterium]